MPAAIVLAGGGPEPRLAPGLPNKAFLEIGGSPLVVRTIDALRGCPAIDRIIVVGPSEPLAALLGPSFEIVPESDSMMDNIGVAVARLTGVRQVLTVASDLPLITAAAVNGFLRLCDGEADFFYPIVRQSAIEGRFPGAARPT